MSYYIYKICCDDLPEFGYVGSTKSFRHRKYSHKQNCINEKANGYNRKLYKTIRENGGWENWRMVILEECGQITFTQARIKEEQHRVTLNATLNMQRCHLTEEERIECKKEYNKEYRENNKEQIKEYNKEYRENNKEQINQRITCECGKEYTFKDKARHEQSRMHKELKKLKQKSH